MPQGCHVGVRVGDILKQGRYEPGRSFNFPAIQRCRNAKIDVYRHIGSCIVGVDPEAKSTQEVKVSTVGDAAVKDFRLKVHVRQATTGVIREKSKQVRSQAKEYLAKHCIEEKLSEAVKALLRVRPENPEEFLCAQIRAQGNQEEGPPQKVEVGPLPRSDAAPPERPIVVSQTSATGVSKREFISEEKEPFSNYVRQHFRTVGASGWSQLHSRFPRNTLCGSGAGMVSTRAGGTFCEGSTAEGRPPYGDFFLKPSVGTWYSKRKAGSPVTHDRLIPPTVQAGVVLKVSGCTSAPMGASQRASDETRTVSFCTRPSVGTWLQPRRRVCWTERVCTRSDQDSRKTQAHVVHSLQMLGVTFGMQLGVSFV